MDGSITRRRVGIRRLAPALLCALVLAGCSDDGGSPEGAGATAQPSASASVPSTAAQPGEAASLFPVPPSPSPETLPDLGTRRGDGWTFTLNGVRRTGDQQVVVEGTLMTHGNPFVFGGLDRSGDDVRPR